MPDYRLFRFCQRGGFASEEILRAADDAEARRLMREKARGAACELWHGTRLIAFIGEADG